ncbi:MAG: hypothetical protein ACOX9C_02065 [Kiritimatiellia bacterium]
MKAKQVVFLVAAVTLLVPSGKSSETTIKGPEQLLAMIMNADESNLVSFVENQSKNPAIHAQFDEMLEHLKGLDADVLLGLERFKKIRIHILSSSSKRRILVQIVRLYCFSSRSSS